MSVYQPGHDISAKERTVDVLTRENVAFKDLLLSPVVLSGLQKARFDRPSPIQLKAIPYGRCGLDLIVQAKSGTGKTCVFTVIALEAISVEAPTLQVVILAPTREIAIQIEDVVKAIGQDIKGLKVAAFIGGRPVSEDKINAKGCHIAVGSPGRIFQLIELEILKCQSVRIFILDEADKLLEDNFQSQINSIYSMLPMNKQMIAASATYPNELAEFVTRYMRDPTFVRLNPKDMALLGVKQYCYVINDPPDKFYSVFERKIKAVVELLDLYPFQQSLIFSNYHSHAKDLSDACNSVGLPATYISGNLEQERRLEAMKMLKDFKCRVLISTDLTSRGIDASNVDLVVNLDVPMDWETFMHRTGRAGRFGSLGAVVSVVTSGKVKNELFEIAKTCAIQLYPLTCESGKLEFGDIPVEFCDTSVGEEKQEYVKTRPKQEKKKPRQNIPQQKIEAHSYWHNSSELHESTNSESTRTSESKNDPELPRIPSLPELMSKTRGSTQISFSYNDLMKNFLHFKEHGIFKELKRIERPKSTTDNTETTAQYPLQDGTSRLNSSRGGARKKTYNGNNGMGKEQTVPSFLTHKHLTQKEGMSLTDRHHNGLQDHLARVDFYGILEHSGAKNPVTAQNAFLSQEAVNPTRPPRITSHQTRRRPQSEHQIKPLQQNSDKHVERQKKEHKERMGHKKSVSDKAVSSRTRDRRKSKNKTNNSDCDDAKASHCNMHPKFLLPKYSENFETEGHSESTSQYFDTMRQYQSAWQNYYYHCWWMQWYGSMSSFHNN